MPTFLPNTSLASITITTGEIYTYAQNYSGQLIEIEGNLEGSPKIYSPTGDDSKVGPTLKDLPPKRFTPLAAVFTRDWNTKQDRRYVFYTDNSNRLCDAYYDGKWRKGDLWAKNWITAPYSKLAAMRITNKIGADFICLYYQNTARTGDIIQVNYSHSGWATGQPPINDPPLVGTSLAAVQPEAGIKSAAGSADDYDPVVFFQNDDLSLRSSQDLGVLDYVTYGITDPKLRLSAHASLTAVDDGTNLWAFYTSDDNSLHRVRVDSSGKLQQPVPIPVTQNPIPASPLTAVIFKGSPETIVLFYLLHDVGPDGSNAMTNVFATTLTRVSTMAADANNWTVSSQVAVNTD